MNGWPRTARRAVRGATQTTSTWLCRLRAAEPRRPSCSLRQLKRRVASHGPKGSARSKAEHVHVALPPVGGRATLPFVLTATTKAQGGLARPEGQCEEQRRGPPRGSAAYGRPSHATLRAHCDDQSAGWPRTARRAVRGATPRTATWLCRLGAAEPRHPFAHSEPMGPRSTGSRQKTSWNCARMATCPLSAPASRKPIAVSVETRSVPTASARNHCASTVSFAEWP